MTPVSEQRRLYKIKCLTQRDKLWLGMLSYGFAIKHLPGMRSEAAIKNRMHKIRWFLKCHTTTHAVVTAMRRGLISLHPESQFILKSERATIHSVEHGPN